MAKKIDYASMYTLRSDGRYQGYWRDADGKRHPVCKKDPKEVYETILLKEAGKDKPILFSDIAEAWKEENWDKLENGTKSSYKAPYNKAVARLGDRVAAEIKPRDILNHLEYLQKQGRGKTSIKVQRTVYSVIFKSAIIDKRFEDQIKENPADNVPLPKHLPEPKERVVPEDEIVQKIQDNAKTAYFGDFAMFLICTGFRRGEALAIKWEDIDFEKKQISCTKQISSHGSQAFEKAPKTKNGVRIVPLLPPLEKMLVRPQEAKDSDYIFYGSDPSKPMPVSTYDRRWMHYCKDMGFVTDSPEQRVSKQGKKYVYHNYKSTLGAHTLRHGYATILFEADVDVYTAQRLLGHANISTTLAIYTHLRNRKNAKSVDNLLKYSENGLSMGDCTYGA